jgi:hypothetical protein
MIASLLVLFGGALIVGWALLYTRTFFSVLWRLFLFAMLLVSLVWFSVLAYPEYEYRTQALVAASIGLILSLSGLVRSFFFKKANL